MADFDGLVPNPYMSDKQFARFHHLDLFDLGDEEITDELHYLRPRLWGLPTEHWLRQRVKALKAEISKRRGNTGYQFSRPKPKPAEGVRL